MQAPQVLAFATICTGSAVTIGLSSIISGIPDSALTDASVTGEAGIADAVRDIVANWQIDGAPHGSQGGLAPGVVGREIAIDEELPETVELYVIPNHETYRYARVNDWRVIVDARSRKIIYIVP